jgi:hypothetical protein
MAAGHILAAEGHWRGRNARELAREPGANQPRQMPADQQHAFDQLTTAFLDMMGRDFLLIRAIQFLVAVTFVLVMASGLSAQEHDHAQMAPALETQPAWTWTTDANVIFGYNYQQRLFADFWAWESQNWGMLTGKRRVGPGKLTLTGMLSLEPWTIGRLVYAQGADGSPQRLFAVTPGGERVHIGGSPQTFQTGESYLGAPLINYQHPHDLFMNLGAMYQLDRGRLKYTFEADVVGSPALGPTAYMHRESARDNPQTPLTHHFIDSTHITPGVLRAGVEVGHLMLETSAFRGEEPDENRLDIDQPRIDSWSARVSWRQGPWQAQFSGGHLHEPEWFDPYDVTRLTASVVFNGTVASKPLNATLAWGENRELLVGPLDGYLFEWDLHLAAPSSFYGRAEKMRKEVLSVGVHPRGLLPGQHPHTLSDISALTLGHVFDLPIPRTGRLGLGADITVYATSPDLESYFGSPHSYHLFLRWRPSRVPPGHVH